MKRENVRDAAARHGLLAALQSAPAGCRGAEPEWRCTAQPGWKSPLRRAWLEVKRRECARKAARRLAIACAAWLAGAALPASAAILTSVPMQGGMVMPMLKYTASTGTLTVTMDPTVPQLTPLLVSNPGDYFDPADPWYDYLDPTRQGRAFSRRYGFVMDTATDLLPVGTAIWIRKLSSSPDLGIFRYRSGGNKAWEPIFGTEGTTNALQWDGTMFHPGVTAPPGTNTYTATFEAFVMDTATGTPVPGANTGPFVFHWTDVPDGRPTLRVGSDMVLTWPAEATNYVLETADALVSASWAAVTNEPVLENGQCKLALPLGQGGRFFRMRLAP
jgi:hypothetical protein